MDPSHASKFEIHAAAREGRTLAVENLIKTNPNLSNLVDSDSRLPIHWAVSYSHLPVVSLLLSRPDFDPDIQDGSGWTPLMIASSLKEAEQQDGAADEIVDLLLNKGADVNIKNYTGQTALHFTSSKNNLSTARKLLANGASARIKDKRGQLPLHRAAAIGSVPFIKLLLGAKSPVNASDVSGYTALHHAISEGHGDVALELLKVGAETDKRDVDGHLAIDLAPDIKVRKYILQAAEHEGIELAA